MAVNSFNALPEAKKTCEGDDDDDDDNNNNNNSIQFLFICVPTHQPNGQLQS
jgi:hypothetical protein